MDVKLIKAQILLCYFLKFGEETGSQVLPQSRDLNNS